MATRCSSASGYSQHSCPLQIFLSWKSFLSSRASGRGKGKKWGGLQGPRRCSQVLGYSCLPSLCLQPLVRLSASTEALSKLNSPWRPPSAQDLGRLATQLNGGESGASCCSGDPSPPLAPVSTTHPFPSCCSRTRHNHAAKLVQNSKCFYDKRK